MSAHNSDGVWALEELLCLASLDLDRKALGHVHELVILGVVVCLVNLKLEVLLELLLGHLLGAQVNKESAKAEAPASQVLAPVKALGSEDHLEVLDDGPLEGKLSSEHDQEPLVVEELIEDLEVAPA